ncbi:hypothetical protein [Lactococcus garvieae]|uniref:hypothetical protein n=1 Tax=Lactococcus garvieae TaxID=1363 RepID=UPI000308656B|nr:hypothetical protein [Lactococcus garvieae]
MENKSKREMTKIELNIWAYLNEIEHSLNQETIDLKRIFSLIDVARDIPTGNAKSDFEE